MFKITHMRCNSLNFYPVRTNLICKFLMYSIFAPLRRKAKNEMRVRFLQIKLLIIIMCAIVPRNSETCTHVFVLFLLFFILLIISNIRTYRSWVKSWQSIFYSGPHRNRDGSKKRMMKFLPSDVCISYISIWHDFIVLIPIKWLLCRIIIHTNNMLAYLLWVMMKLQNLENLKKNSLSTDKIMYKRLEKM